MESIGAPPTSRLKGSGFRVKAKNTFLVVDEPCFRSSFVFQRSMSEPPPTTLERKPYLGDIDAMDEQSVGTTTTRCEHDDSQEQGSSVTEHVTSASSSLDTLPPLRVHCDSTVSTSDVLPPLSEGHRREWLQEKRGIGGTPYCSATAIAVSVVTTSDPAPTPHSNFIRVKTARAPSISEGCGMFGGSTIGSVTWIFGTPDQSVRTSPVKKSTSSPLLTTSADNTTHKAFSTKMPQKAKPRQARTHNLTPGL